MGLLLAILLAFLAQNLVTPWPYDFAAVCGALGLLMLLEAARSRGRVGGGPYVFAALAGLLIIAWQLLPASLAAGIFMLLASLLFVYQTREANPPAQLPPLRLSAAATRNLQVATILAILVAAAVLSIYDNEQIPPGLHGDEAESGIEARNLNAGKYSSLIGVGWYDQPLASFLVQAAGLRIFGDEVSGLRTTSAVISLAALPLFYWLTRRLFGSRAALIALALMAFAHWFIAFARIGINYNQTLVLELAAVLAFWEGWQTRKWFWWLVCGLATGAGMYLYFASRMVPVLLAAFAAYLWWAGRSHAGSDLHSPTTEPQRAVRRLPCGRLRSLISELQAATSILLLPFAPPPLSLAAGAHPARRHLALWLIVTALIFAPMGVFFVYHAKELNSRAAFVFLFSDTQYNTRAEKLQIYTGTQDVPTALFVQVERYATLFNIGGDRSGQYGNSLSLLDYYTAVFFVLGLAYALPRWREPRFMLLLLWLVLTVFFGGVLTIESPFTPRIIGVMPVPFMLAAVALEQVYVRMRAGLSTPTSSELEARSGTRLLTALRGLSRWAPAGVLVVLLTASIYWNYWAYFDRYIHSIDGWAQREPATAIAKYAAQMQSDQTLYVLSQPDLFVWHGTIRFLAPSVRGLDLMDPSNDLPIHDAATRRASFVMLPNHLEWLALLRSLYPRGEYKQFSRPSGELWYTIYEVSAGEIATRR
jgi:Dolichyl-phosphate-mannose-protein mannosyltransferase